MSDAAESVSVCLRQLDAGDEEAIGRLIPLIYDDLRRLARRIQGSGGHLQSLNPTALVHEAFGRLVERDARGFENRRHFMRVAALAMRQLLADRARERRALKRGGGAERITLHAGAVAEEGADIDLVALDDALGQFAKQFPRQARVVELRFLAGLSVEETAEILGVSPRTTKTDWQLARAWLSKKLSED